MAFAAATTEIPGVIPFSTEDRSTLGIRWTRWMRGFELYVIGKGITDNDQKKALLLHCAGLEVQDIFYTLTIPDPGEGENAYDICKDKLNEFFLPKVNTAFERAQFRSLSQGAEESMDQFVTRLRQKAVYCNFTNVEENIRDQVIEKCSSSRLRRKILERDNVSLEDACKIARSLESFECQAVKLEGPSETVNKVKWKQSTASTGKKDQTFFRKKQLCCACGYEGHIKSDPKCPARGKKCKKCHGRDHFKSCCKTKDKNKAKKKHDKVRSLETDKASSKESGEEYMFSVKHQNQKSSAVTVNIGGILAVVLIDSGASVNVIDRRLWETLKKKKIKCTSRVTDKKLNGYGNPNPLSVAGCFEAVVSTDNSKCKADFFVIEEKGAALLGRDTSLELGLLKIGTEKLTKEGVLKKFPNCFQGVGKLKNCQLKILIDESVDPVIQPVRRIPFHLREKLESWSRWT